MKGPFWSTDQEKPSFPRTSQSHSRVWSGKGWTLATSRPWRVPEGWGEESRAEQRHYNSVLCRIRALGQSQIYCHCDCPLVPWAAAVSETYAWSFPRFHIFNTSSGNRFPTFIPFVHIGDQGETDQKKIAFLSYIFSYFLYFIILFPGVQLSLVTCKKTSHKPQARAAPWVSAHPTSLPGSLKPVNLGGSQTPGGDYQRHFCSPSALAHAIDSAVRENLVQITCSRWAQSRGSWTELHSLCQDGRCNHPPWCSSA